MISSNILFLFVLSCQQSMESGYSCELFDTPFGFKPSVRNVSFDGCFIEDDFSPIVGDLNPKFQGSVKGTQWVS